MPKRTHYTVTLYSEEYEDICKRLPYKDPKTGEVAKDFCALARLALRKLPRKKQ